MAVTPNVDETIVHLAEVEGKKALVSQNGTVLIPDLEAAGCTVIEKESGYEISQVTDYPNGVINAGFQIL